MRNFRGLILIIIVIGLAIVLFFIKSYVPLFNDEKTQNTTNINNVAEESELVIKVTENGFVPKEAVVKAGTRVSWINESGKTVTVNSDDHPTHKKHPTLNLGEFQNGSSVQSVFSVVGTYNYHNHLSPSQKGTVVVENGS